MAEERNEKMQFEEKAKETFNAERREDYAVLIIATITVILVVLGIIGTQFYSSLFFKY
ncbi:MAG: hypothetical protein QMD43_04200 [Thermodesulfovibrio sp.]|uniref:hypothetical protein n=1 Tax=unclassified Thermodesulfovibrio TaxID=2645936 RepID=UPI00085713FE|nr:MULTISPECIES: hypothetical protein [unclassified Thermodesulfovibrio]MDI1472349.1 hypothetical protein [Thermodesulfovibrio sp. 1176]MDI6714214.1 hypothetical protein [Thermodesulfovibrio sp.]ODA43770.1 hypothetical protein THER_1525 [Thermodesulfovibrio sp. N1]